MNNKNDLSLQPYQEAIQQSVDDIVKFVLMSNLSHPVNQQTFKELVELHLEDIAYTVMRNEQHKATMQQIQDSNRLLGTVFLSALEAVSPKGNQEEDGPA